MISLDEELEDSRIPHIARMERRINGCPEGNLQCQNCGAMNASKNRQRTAYADSDNMATLCPVCQQEADEYWDDMWEEYYSMIRE